MRELFAIAADKLLRSYVTPALISACEDGIWPSDLWAAIDDAGFGVALAAEEHGGAGASWSDVLAIVQSAGAHAAPVPLCETLLANWALGQAGVHVSEGPVTLCGDVELNVVSGRVTGLARAVPWGRSAQHIVVITHDETPQLLVLATAHAQITPASNIAREPRDDLYFDDACVVAKAALPPTVGVESLRLGGAMLRAGQMAGGLSRLVELTVSYANDRVQFGRAIAKFQAVQQQIAVLAMQAALANAAADQAFSRADNGLCPFDIAVAKISAGEAAGAGAAIAHAVHGAIGFSYEHALHLTTRRLWSWRDEFGAEAWWAARLGHQACASKADNFWPAITRGGFENNLL